MMQVQTATSGGYSRVKVSLLVSTLARRSLSSTDMLSQETGTNFHPQILVVVCNAYKNISHFASQPGRDTNSLG